MCNQLINKCTKPGCNKANKLASEPVLCKKAKDNGNRPCKTLTDSVVDEDQRQLCKDHSGKDKLCLPSKRSSSNASDKDNNSSARSMKSDDDTSLLNRGRKDTTAITKSVGEMALEDKVSSAWNSRASSKSTSSRAGQSMSKQEKGKQPAQGMAEDSTVVGPFGLVEPRFIKSVFGHRILVRSPAKQPARPIPEGYTNRYRGFPYETARPLAPEPAIWQEWREKPPSDVGRDPDAPDARYAQALQTHRDRAFPLPYEYYAYYEDRQLCEVGRALDETGAFHREYNMWMEGDRQFIPAKEPNLRGLTLPE